MGFTVREDFLEPNEPAPKLVNANAYDKMMERENYLNFTSATNSEVETVDWNNHGWEEEGKEPLDSLHTKFDHWKVKGLGARPIIEGDFFAVSNDSFSYPSGQPDAGTNNLNLSKSNVNRNPMNIVDLKKFNFSNIQGKGKLCKAGGLTGAEKKACAKNIKATCGKKPMFGKAKKIKWAECAKGAVISPEEQAQATAEKLVPASSDKEGMSMGAKVMLIVAGVGTLALIGFAIMRSRKSGGAQTASMVKPAVVKVK